MTLLQERNEKAFSYLYDNYSGAIFGIINSIVTDKDIANDVLQNVFVNIWRKIESYDTSKGRLFTWMLNIARNASIDELRSKGFRQSQKNQSLNDNVDIPGASNDPVIEDVGLKKILAGLKSEWSVLVDMSFFQGFTHEEISKILDIPLGTVKTRIRSALSQLRTMLQP